MIKSAAKSACGAVSGAGPASVAILAPPRRRGNAPNLRGTAKNAARAAVRPARRFAMLAGMTDYPRIPYGLADFRRIRREGYLYVDKTRFLRPLEEVDFAVFIRPRRFGKSCWISLLEHYYDRRFSGEFDALFAGTEIGSRPTEERHRYMVLRFNFSAFKIALDTLEGEFESYCHTVLRDALVCHPDLFQAADRERILSAPSVNGKLTELFAFARRHGIRLYGLIDEYDNFANTILSQQGEDAYRTFTHGGGFYRNFFATLKAGTEQGALRRLFVTGVSPITLDDVTSGFNIGRNISLDPRFNELTGLTEAEVRDVLERYRDLGAFAQDVDEALDIMREWYDGYRFARTSKTTLYNTDMVLYYLDKALSDGAVPENLIDVNVRIDYTKLRHLLVVGNRLNGNFDLLRRVIGEERVEADIQPSFPLERLNERENFLSLLHYFGLLSIREVVDGETVLGIPNQTVRHLLYGHLRDAYRDVGLFSVDVFRLGRRLRRMGSEGVWEPVIGMISDRIAEHSRIRDYIAGEKVLQAFLLAYLTLNERFVSRSEVELSGGYADLVLEPNLARYPRTRFGFVIELKYISRAAAGHVARQRALRDKAAAQLQRYLVDKRLKRQYPRTRFIGLVLVYHGWELVINEAVTAD